MASNDLVSLGEEMINCYKDIYGQFYSFDEKWVNSSVELLEKNLSELNINNEALKEKIILNIQIYFLHFLLSNVAKAYFYE